MRKDVQPESLVAFDLANVSKNERAILEAFERAGAVGRTDDELQSTGLPFGSVGSTRHGLMKKGVVQRTEQKRLTRNGRPARVYVLAPRQMSLI